MIFLYFSIMKASNLNEAIRTLSIDRLNSYKSYFNLTDYEECLNLYLWNDAISSSYFRLISIFEVAFRNTLHRELSHQFHSFKTQGNVFDNDWYTHLSTSGIINPVTIGILEQTTHQKVSARGGARSRKVPKSPAPPPGKVIAAQSIGFWMKLIETTRTTIDWKTILFHGFKGHFANNVSYWDTAAIDDLLMRLEQITELRNRIAHHEPLWKFTAITNKRTNVLIYPSATTPSESILRMQTLHHRICLILGWVSRDRKEDYLNSYYKKNFDWVCREETIDLFRLRESLSGYPLAKVKRNFHKILKNNYFFEIKHKNSTVFFTRDI